MITANEFRTGNKVLSCLTKEIVTVDWLVIKHIGDGNYQNVYNPHDPVYEPIPLTEEWLLRFGLKRGYKKVTIEFAPDFYLHIDEEMKVSIEEYGEGEQLLEHIQYVHQLQNLYFALVGLELELTELPQSGIPETKKPS